MVLCRDCNELTHNRTERCGICRVAWRNNMSKVGETLQKKDNLLVRKQIVSQSQEIIDHKYGKKVLYAKICVRCNIATRALSEEEWSCANCSLITEPQVDHPKHYNTGNIEVIDAIEQWELDFRLGNAVKYIARSGKKNPDKIKEDLKKSIWYIQRYIDKECGDK